MNASTTPPRRASGDSVAATRDALVAAARSVVRRHGFAGATSRRIATEAGANLASITYYFGSKDELVAGALFGHLEERLAPVMDLVESDTGAELRLAVAVRQLVGEFERADDDVAVYLNALLLATEEGPLADRARSLLGDLRSRLASVIERLVIDGVIAAWVQPEAMASLLVATANGMAFQSRLDPDGPGVADLAGQFAGLLLAASAPPGR